LRWHYAWLVLFGVSLASAGGCRSLCCSHHPQPPSGPPLARNPTSSIWLISGRGIDPLASGPNYYRYQGPEQWVPAAPGEFHSTDSPDERTVVFVHGGRCTEPEAVVMGWELLEQLAARDAGPFRYVIYSWPAERTDESMLADLRLWESKTEMQGPPLASALQGIDPRQPVSLVGHSFGGAIILSAMDWMGGGDSQARGPNPVPACRQFRVTLVAPAVEADCLLPGHRFDHALAPLERMLVLYNSHDLLMRHYNWLKPGLKQRSLGQATATGLDQLGLDGTKVIQRDVSSVMHFFHRWKYYVDRRVLESYAADFALYHGGQ
jgi:hypothetical protein